MPGDLDPHLQCVPPAATEPSLHFRRILIVGLVGAAALVASNNVPFFDDGSPNHPTDTASAQTHETHRQSLADPTPPEPAEATEPSKKHCTTVRFDGQYINMNGKLCAEDGAKASKVGNGYPRFGWILAVVTIDNLVTCGYIRPKVLPKRKPPSGSISDCKEYRPIMINRELIEDPNCGDINGNDSCKSGTWYSPVSENCSSEGVVYRRFATKKPSPWNLRGVSTPAFSKPLSATENKSVSYRGELSIPGDTRKAISVRTEDGWGVMPSDCVEQKYRYGGTCKDRERNKNELGDIVCGSASRVRRSAESWRKLSGN